MGSDRLLVVNDKGKQVTKSLIDEGADIVLKGSEALRVVMAGNFIMCPTLCLQKSVVGDRRFSNEWRQVQDLEFTSRLLMDGEELVGARETAYAYRRHPENATAVQSEPGSCRPSPRRRSTTA